MQLLQLLWRDGEKMSKSHRRVERVRQRTDAALPPARRSTESAKISHRRRTEKQTTGSQVDSEVQVINCSVCCKVILQMTLEVSSAL